MELNPENNPINPENNPINVFFNNQHHVITNINNLNMNSIVIIVDGIRYQVNYINPDNWLNYINNDNNEERYNDIIINYLFQVENVNTQIYNNQNYINNLRGIPEYENRIDIREEVNYYEDQNNHLRNQLPEYQNIINELAQMN